MFYSRRKRSQSFGSYGSYRNRKEADDPSAKPELVEGYAHVCFDQHVLGFRGIMQSSEGTAFSLLGKRARPLDENTVAAPPVCDSGSGSGSAPVTTTVNVNMNVKPDSPIDHIDKVDDIDNNIDKKDAAFKHSRQNSMDGHIERQLQFIMEEIPLVAREQPISPTSVSSGSPPTDQQIVRALDQLLLNDVESVMEQDECADESEYRHSPLVTPFRSRSGSRSQMENMAVVFDVTVSDLEEGSQHHIRSISGRTGASGCTLRNRQLCFVTDRSFWGQRADMIIQKQLAAPDLVGQGCHVFAGPMRFYYNPVGLESSSSFTNWCW